MKKIIFVIILAQALFFNMLNSSPIDYSNLPVYTGSLNDPGVTIVVYDDEFYVLEIDGELFIFLLQVISLSIAINLANRKKGGDMHKETFGNKKLLDLCGYG